MAETASAARYAKWQHMKMFNYTCGFQTACFKFPYFMIA